MLAPWHAPSLRPAVHNIVDVLVPARSGAGVDAEQSRRAALRDPLRPMRTPPMPTSYTGDNLMNIEAPGRSRPSALAALEAAVCLMLCVARFRVSLHGRGTRPARGTRYSRRSPPGPDRFRDRRARSSAATDVACPMPWTASTPTTHTASRSEPDSCLRGCPSPPEWGALSGRLLRHRIPTSMLSLYRSAIAARRNHFASATHYGRRSYSPTTPIWSRSNAPVLLVVLNAEAGLLERSIRRTGRGAATVVLSSVAGHTNPHDGCPPTHGRSVARVDAGRDQPNGRCRYRRSAAGRCQRRGWPGRRARVVVAGSSRPTSALAAASPVVDACGREHLNVGRDVHDDLRAEAFSNNNLAGQIASV